MRNLVALLIVGIIGWQGYQHYRSRLALPAASEAEPSSSNFKCDSRKHCSQMTSCAEATFFLRNCPGVKMDGNNDGVPCEQQWCRR